MVSRFRFDAWRQLAAVAASLALVYFLIQALPSSGGRDPATVGYLSSYFGSSYYEDTADEYEYPDRVGYSGYGGVRERACLVMVARNTELYELLWTVKSVEDRFNIKYNYDWVFVNNRPFSKEFKYVIGEIVSGKVKFVTAPADQWGMPSSLDPEQVFDARKKLVLGNVAKSEYFSLSHLWRYRSGFMFNDPAFEEYEYYMNIDRDMRLACDINYDIFKFMKDNKKKYGFVHSRYTPEGATKSLWGAVKEFKTQFESHINPNNMISFVSTENSDTYNRCGYETGVEIGSLDFFRSKPYQDFFNFIDAKQGWYYERWADSDMRSIATSLLLDKSEVHHFADLGFLHILGKHESESACPSENAVRLENRCSCNPFFSLTWNSKSCLPRFYTASGNTRPKSD